MSLADHITQDINDIIEKWCPDHYLGEELRIRLVCTLLEANACSEAQYAVAIGQEPLRPINTFKPYREPV